MRKLVAVLLSALIAVIGMQAPAQARPGLSVGMTVHGSELEGTWAQFQGYHIDSVRVFSPSGPPPWSDSRIQFLKQKRSVPFISFKTFDVAATRAWLMSMPSDIPQIYLAHHHEPEADMSAATYRSRQVAMWNMVQGLPSGLRARVKFGPIQTKQWTENNGRSYSEYDPGVGDFWGVDAYVNSWSLDYPDVNAWWAQIRAYNTGGRPKWIPELGAVSLPYDDDDTARALWVARSAAIIESVPDIKLVLWWHTEGTAGGYVPGLCTRRDFRLHAHTECNAQGAYATTHVAPSRVQWQLFQNRNTP